MSTINILKIVHLCHEIQDAAKRKETKNGGTIMCAHIASKILIKLANHNNDPLPSATVDEEPPKDDRSEDGWFQDPNEGDRS